MNIEQMFYIGGGEEGKREVNVLEKRAPMES